MKTFHKTILEYNFASASDREVCEALYSEITSVLTKEESKIWHGAPVWFLDVL